MTDRVPGAPGQYQAVITAAELAKLQSGEAFAITLTRDDQPITQGTPYSKAAVLPDELAALICPAVEDPTPADALGALLPLNGSKAMAADLPMGGHKITGLADPITATDAAPKGYVDAGFAPIHRIAEKVCEKYAYTRCNIGPSYGMVCAIYTAHCVVEGSGGTYNLTETYLVSGHGFSTYNYKQLDRVLVNTATDITDDAVVMRIDFDNPYGDSIGVAAKNMQEYPATISTAVLPVCGTIDHLA